MLRALVILLCWLSIARAQSPALGYFGKGNTLMQAERYEEAADQFRQALASDATLTEARKNLAICDFEQRDYTAARQEFEALATGKHAGLAAYYLGRLFLLGGNFDSAIARLHSAAQRHAPPDAEYFLGIAYYKRGSTQQAIAALRRYLILNPKDFRAHQWLARALSKSGLPADASKEFSRARELHNYYSQGSVVLGACAALLKDHKRDDAWKTCSPVLSTDDPDKAAAFGMLFGQTGDDEHALPFWTKAVTLDPESPEANYNLALAYFQTQSIPQAKPYAQAACTLWPEFPEANILYGTILYMLAQDQEAIRVLTQAHALCPEDQNVKRLLTELRSHAPQPQN